MYKYSNGSVKLIIFGEIKQKKFFFGWKMVANKNGFKGTLYRFAHFHMNVFWVYANLVVREIRL